MRQVTVYTMDYCPYCERAKELLTRRGVPFREVRLETSDEQAWDDLYDRSGMRTMPQIFVTENGPEGPKERLVGGYAELVAIDAKDALASLR